MPNPPAMASAKIELRAQPPIDADVVLQAPDWTVSSVHRSLFDPEQTLSQRLVEAARDLVGGSSPGEARETLLDAGATALDGLYATLAVAVVDELSQPAGADGEDLSLWDFIGLTRELGSGSDRFGVHSGTEDLSTGAVPIFAASDVTPTIGIVLDETFTQARRAHREEVLELIMDLAQGCEVYLIAGQIERQFLWTQHRAQLPGRVEAQCNPRVGDRASPSAVETQVQAAHAQLNTDSPAVKILTLLEQEPAQMLTYSQLSTMLYRDRSTIRYHVTQRLQEYDLVDRFDHHGQAAVSLTLVGEQFLDRLDSETAGRRGGDTSVEGASSSSEDIREAPREHGPPPKDSPAVDGVERQQGIALVQPYSRSQATAAVAGSENTDIGIVDHPVGDIVASGGDFREGRWWFDADRDEMVVGAQWHSPLQYALCLAFALSSWRTWDQVLTSERLDAEIFEDVVLSDPWFLRGTRQLGYLKDRSTNGDDYVSALENARDDLYELTRKLEYGDYSEEQRELRRDILREAHGLIGTVTHLLDLCDIEVVREVRIPNYSRDFHKEDRLDDILRFMGKAVPISSTYGEFVAEKILFESREKKRKFALCAPDVDIDHPTGRHIGSWTIVGQFGSTVDEFQRSLDRELSAPNPLQQDGPHYAEFVVDVDIRQVDDRAAYEMATDRLLEAKWIDPVDEAVNWLKALVGSVYDLTNALHYLGKEDFRRIESRDLVYALSTLPAKRLVPDAKPTVGKILHALLQAGADRDQSGRLTKIEIADRAGISESSVYDGEHWLVLEEIGAVAKTENGWEIAIRLPSDREDPQLPWWMEGSLANLRDVLWNIEDRIAPDDTDYLNDPPPAYEAIQWPPDFKTLVQAWPWIDPWLDIICSLLDQEAEEDSSRRVVTFGEAPQQETLYSLIERAIAD